MADSYPDQALQHARRALAIAREIAHPFSIVNAHVVNAMVHQLRREPSDSLAHAEAGMSLARTYGMTHETAKAGLFNAWALVMLGRVVQGLAEMRGIVAELRVEWRQFVPHLLGILADALAAADRPSEALAAIEEALSDQHTGGSYYKAELLRLKGALLESRTAAQSCLEKALARRTFAASALARAQGHGHHRASVDGGGQRARSETASRADLRVVYRGFRYARFAGRKKALGMNLRGQL